MEVLAKRLKWLREQKRLTQKEVAAEIGMSLNGLQKIEGNERNPKLDVLINIAKLFNVSTDFLLGLDNANNRLQSIKHEIIKAKARYEESELKLKHFLDKADDLRRKIKAANMVIVSNDNKTDFEKEVFVKMQDRINDLNEIIENRTDVEKIHRQSKEDYHYWLCKYITTLSELPIVTILDDEVLNSVKPLSFELTLSPNGKYDLEIVSEIEGFLGYIVEEAPMEQVNVLRDIYESIFIEVLK